MSRLRTGRPGATAIVIACVAGLAVTGCGSGVAPAGTAVERSKAPQSKVALPCPPPDAAGSSAIDWVPFVVVDDVAFQSTMPPTSIDETALGAIVSTVTCTIADVVGNPEYATRDGDAAYLPVGTELREVLGYRTDFRLAAHEGESWTIYESYRRDDIATGEDLLDLRDKVTAIHRVEGDDGRDIEQTVDDPATVAAIVDAVLAAPAVPENEHSYDESPVFVRFDLLDGTSVQRAWHVDAGIFALDFRAPPELVAALHP